MTVLEHLRANRERLAMADYAGIEMPDPAQILTALRGLSDTEVRIRWAEIRGEIERLQELLQVAMEAFVATRREQATPIKSSLTTYRPDGALQEISGATRLGKRETWTA